MPPELDNNMSPFSTFSYLYATSSWLDFILGHVPSTYVVSASVEFHIALASGKNWDTKEGTYCQTGRVRAFKFRTCSEPLLPAGASVSGKTIALRSLPMTKVTAQHRRTSVSRTLSV